MNHTLGFSFEFDGQHAAARDDWQRDANGYRVTFRYNRRRASFDYWQGSGITSDPTANDVMACLVSDAQAGELSFDEFCGEFGYDEDSRKAEQTWKACKVARNQLQALFGADYSDALETDWESRD